MNEVNESCERLERAVSTAARRERAAWNAYEQARRAALQESDPREESTLRACRGRWQTAARLLVEALEAHKTREEARPS